MAESNVVQWKSILDFSLIDVDGLAAEEAAREWSWLMARITNLPAKVIMESTPSSYSSARADMMWFGNKFAAQEKTTEEKKGDSPGGSCDP